MIQLLLEQRNEQKISYRYFVRDKNNYGVITLFLDNGEIRIEKPMEGPDAAFYGGYAHSAIRRFVKKNIFPDKDILAWC